jgi:thioredoxin-related protein
MNKIYLFTIPFSKDCMLLKGELARVEGGLEIEEVKFRDDNLEPTELAQKFGVRGVPTLVKVNEHGTVTEALAGYKYTRGTFEKFLEAGV